MKRKILVGALLILAVSSVPSIAMANGKAGAACPKAGATTTISGAKYQCTKSIKGLIWAKVSTSAKATHGSTSSTSKIAQTITPPQTKSVAITDAKFGGSFVASSKLPVTLSTSTPLICSIQGEAIAPLQTGNCEIAATQAGSDKYLPATPMATTINVTAPTITSANPLLDQVQSFVRVPLGTTYASDTSEITLTSFTNDASTKVCANDSSALGCVLSNGSGVPDPASHTRYVEFAFHVKNLDSNPLPSISYRLLLFGVLSDVDAGVTLQTLNGMSVGSGESADGSLYGLVPIKQDLKNGFLIIDEGITDPSIRLLLNLSN